MTLTETELMMMHAPAGVFGPRPVLPTRRVPAPPRPATRPTVAARPAAPTPPPAPPPRTFADALASIARETYQRRRETIAAAQRGERP